MPGTSLSSDALTVAPEVDRRDKRPNRRTLGSQYDRTCSAAAEDLGQMLKSRMRTGKTIPLPVLANYMVHEAYLFRSLPSQAVSQTSVMLIKLPMRQRVPLRRRMRDTALKARISRQVPR